MEICSQCELPKLDTDFYYTSKGKLISPCKLCIKENNANYYNEHIIPHSTFQYLSMEDESFKKCWALENLRPLSAKINNFDGANRIRHDL